MFNQGDKVVCINNSHTINKKLLLNNIYTINSISNLSNGDYVGIKIDNDYFEFDYSRFMLLSKIRKNKLEKIKTYSE